MAAAAMYGILHVLLYKVLNLIFLIPNLLTFGLFSFVISTFLLFITARLIDDFAIDGFFTTLLAAVLLTLLNGVWYRLLLH
jgi:putative membrane protein